jgi:hypothetical protein
MGLADSKNSALLPTSFNKLPNSTCTMRTRILPFAAAILTIGAVLVLFCLTKEKEHSTAPVAESSFTKQPVSAELHNSKPVAQSGVAERNTTATPPTKNESTAALHNRNVIDTDLLANWQAPIEFFGKVVDENGNPVSGASVNFHWVEFPDENGNRSTNTESDAEGLFSLRGVCGPILTVLVSKEGYYPRRGGAHYGPLAAESFSPDPKDPVVFVLRKKGTPEPLVAINRSYQIPRGGTPVSINLETGNAMTGRSGHLVVQCWTEDSGKRSGEKYDWRCLITIPGGGLALTEEEFPFLAPENGYVPTTEIVMPAARPDWKSDVELKFYYRLADGRFGRMTFSMIAGGDHFCMIESFLNPTGSRNLEPKE